MKPDIKGNNNREELLRSYAKIVEGEGLEEALSMVIEHKIDGDFMLNNDQLVLLLSDEDEMVGYCAGMAFNSRIIHEHTYKNITDLCHSDRAEVRAACADVLSVIHNDSGNFYHDEDDDLVSKRADQHDKYLNTSIEILSKLKDDSDNKVRYEALYGLFALSKKAPEHVANVVNIENLVLSTADDKNAKIRMLAASSLPYSLKDTSKGLELLENLRNDDDEEVAYTAAGMIKGYITDRTNPDISFMNDDQYDQFWDELESTETDVYYDNRSYSELLKIVSKIKEPSK